MTSLSERLPSVALDGSTAAPERSGAIERLRAGELCAIFTVDIFNEGEPAQ